jgi:hypothetical protein
MSIWLKGLLSAVLSGAAVGATAVFVMPITVSTESFKILGYMVLVGAVVGLLNYLKQSPLP